MKIKLTESEAEHWFCSCLSRLRSSENCIVGVASRSRIIDQGKRSIPGLAIGWFFRFRLRQPSFHCVISDGVINGIGRNGNVPILLTLLTTPIFDFHLIISSLVTPTTTTTQTLSLVKTSLKEMQNPLLDLLRFKNLGMHPYWIKELKKANKHLSSLFKNLCLHLAYVNQWTGIEIYQPFADYFKIYSQRNITTSTLLLSGLGLK